jgi:hypothetical protein
MPLPGAAGRVHRQTAAHATTPHHAPGEPAHPTGVGTTAFTSEVPPVSACLGCRVSLSKHFQGYSGRRPQRGRQTSSA